VAAPGRISCRGPHHEQEVSVTEVRNNPEQSRYEAVVDGEVAGFAAYQLTNQIIVFTHTEVDPAYEGQGIGSLLAQTALDDVRRSGDRQVLPLCPFVSAWIGRHRDYADLVYGAPASTARD
jgi:predicted GNAT family acetyltransferase